MGPEKHIMSTIEAMVGSFHEGDIPGILSTYEPGAVVVGEPGKPISGRAELVRMFEGFIAAKARFTFFGHEVTQAGDLAVHLAPWRMTGVGPDGSPINGTGLSVAVLRRQPNGTWLMVIDNPYGDSTLNRAAATQEGR